MDGAEHPATGSAARVPARPSGPAPVGIAGRRSEGVVLRVVGYCCGLRRRRRGRSTEIRPDRRRVRGEPATRPASAPRRTIRRIHFVISGTMEKAIRWEWITVNPAAKSDKPKTPPPQPGPPSQKDAARIVNQAWEQDAAWGTLVWLVVVTGLRRAELVGLRWADVDFEAYMFSYQADTSQPCSPSESVAVTRGCAGISESSAICTQSDTSPQPSSSAPMWTSAPLRDASATQAGERLRCGSTPHGWRNRTEAPRSCSQVGFPEECREFGDALASFVQARKLRPIRFCAR